MAMMVVIWYDLATGFMIVMFDYLKYPYNIRTKKESVASEV